MLQPEELWEIFYNLEGEPELSDREDTPPPTPPPTPPSPPKILLFAPELPRKVSASQELKHHPNPRSCVSRAQDTVAKGTKGEVRTEDRPLVQRLQKGQDFPWKEVWFLVAPWLPAYLVEHLENRIRRAGGNETIHPALATHIIINPHPSYYHLSKAYFDLPNVQSCQTNVLSWHWVSQCYFTQKVPRAFSSLPLFTDKEGEALKVAVGDIGEARWEVMVALESHGALVVPENETKTHIVHSSLIPDVTFSVENGEDANVRLKDEIWVSECVRQRKVISDDEWRRCRGSCLGSSKPTKLIRLPRITFTSKKNQALPRLMDVFGSPTSNITAQRLSDSISPIDTVDCGEEKVAARIAQPAVQPATTPVTSRSHTQRQPSVNHAQAHRRSSAPYDRLSSRPPRYASRSLHGPRPITPLQIGIPRSTSINHGPRTDCRTSQAGSPLNEVGSIALLKALPSQSQTKNSESDLLSRVALLYPSAAERERDRDRQRILDAGIELVPIYCKQGKMTKRGGTYTSSDRDVLARWVAWLRPDGMDHIGRGTFALLDELPKQDTRFSWIARHRSEGWAKFYVREYRLSLDGMDEENHMVGFCKLVEKYQRSDLDVGLSTRDERETYLAAARDREYIWVKDGSKRFRVAKA